MNARLLITFALVAACAGQDPAAPDAGGLDASIVDALVIDAGVDAFARDAFAQDAVTLDMGSRDTSVRDAFVIDAAIDMNVTPACSNGLDDDHDGHADFPSDPGCVTPMDTDETDGCPAGASCPACANGIDDDGDGETDYPADPSCASASTPTEACTGERDPILTITGYMTIGTLVGAHDDQTPTCGGGGVDVVYAIHIPETSRLDISITSTTSANPILSLLRADCVEPSIACSARGTNPVIDPLALSAGDYLLVVDGDPGTFTLEVSGIVAPGASCEPEDTLNRALECAGLSCPGAVGSRTCPVPQCNNGIDDNADGRTDFPSDPSCQSSSGELETTVCPGPSCPACANGIDDDADGFTDWPADVGCSCAASRSEAFCNGEQDIGGPITMPTTMGTLAGAHADLSEPCRSTTGNDVTFALVLPVQLATLHIDTLGSTVADTVLTVRDSRCFASFACDDDDGASTLSSVTIMDPPTTTLAVTVDVGGTASPGAFHLNVHGTVHHGEACTDLLFTNGVLTCEAGTTCTSGTCQ